MYLTSYLVGGFGEVPGVPESLAQGEPPPALPPGPPSGLVVSLLEGGGLQRVLPWNVSLTLGVTSRQLGPRGSAPRLEHVRLTPLSLWNHAAAPHGRPARLPEPPAP